MHFPVILREFSKSVRQLFGTDSQKTSVSLLIILSCLSIYSHSIACRPYPPLLHSIHSRLKTELFKLSYPDSTHAPHAALVSWAFARIGGHRPSLRFPYLVFSIRSCLPLDFNCVSSLRPTYCHPFGRPFTYSLFR